MFFIHQDLVKYQTSSRESTSMRWGPLLANWGPVVLWAALIFCFSTEFFSMSRTSQIPRSAHQLDAIHRVIRKLGHWSEYFIFSILVLRALRHQFNRSELYHGALTIVMVLLYGISDELHQAFVPNRTASFRDVLIDLLGGICAIFWLALCRRLKR